MDEAFARSARATAVTDQVAAAVADRLPLQVEMARRVLVAVGDRDHALMSLAIHFVNRSEGGGVGLIAAAALLRLAELEQPPPRRWWPGKGWLRRPARPRAVHVCTGVSASWCPNHGYCICPGRETLNHPECPLHASDSPHAEGPTGR